MVYVDDMQAPYGRMRMSHMIADSTEELLAMADRIGVDRRWIQQAGTYREHFDICQSKRRLAVTEGAVPVSRMELGRRMVARKWPRYWVLRPGGDATNEFGQCETCHHAFESEERICRYCIESGGKIIDIMEALKRALEPRGGATEKGEGSE